MRKRLILIIVFVVIATTLFGCGEHYPSVKIDESMFASQIDIDVGHGYKYTGFDIDTIDGGKDLILHFAEDES